MRRLKNIIRWGVKKLLKVTVVKLLVSIEWIHPKYRIDGLKTLGERDLLEYKNPFGFDGNLNEYYQDMKKLVGDSLREKKKLSIIRLGDGEALFLQGQQVGNIAKRHLTEGNIENLDLEEWKSELLRNDLLTFDLRKRLLKYWRPVLGEYVEKNFYPLQTVYALVATRDIFEMLRGHSIGLIGADKKLKLIEELMKREEYQGYLGIKGFDQYIAVPETGACNNTEDMLTDIYTQIGEEACDIYLLGAGISKMMIMSKIRDRYDTIVVDVGMGIDAIAGIIHNRKTFMADWQNYHIKGYDYSDIDILWANDLDDGYSFREIL